ncbi:Copper-exporting P-type ATPase [Acidibacillus sp. S0AB]|uniref:P-type Cu(+) transporter n=2 Tax=Sulfoacidibacillus ferrooxidans TaxID=2005001 RepID=A0A9X1V687_9BACL|nr:Copper-exporting P-type ATPase [Sulfoacidibacillus ferrooxidans]
MAILTCHLCEQPATTPILDSGYTFCCHGCKELWHVLGEDELQRLKATPGINWIEARGLERPGDFFAQEATDAHTVTLSLDGIWCASCTLLIEHVVQQTPGVFAAKVDFSTSTAQIAYDRETVSPTALCDTIGKLGYNATADDDGDGNLHTADVILLRRFSVAALLSLVMMMLSVPVWTGYLPLLPQGMRLLLSYSLWILSTPVIFWSGWPFLRGAWSSIRHFVPTMDLLIAIGSVSAYAYSVVSVLQSGQFVYFDTASLLVSFLLFSRTLEAQTKRKASQVVSLLGRLAPKEARVVKDSHVMLLPIADVMVGDVVRIETGETIPVDGTVISGQSAVDESMLTGESLWVDKHLKDPVYAGTTNHSGLLEVAVSRVTDTLLKQTTDFVRNAENHTLRYQRLADRILKIFVPFVLFTATGTFAVLVWGLHTSMATALLRSVAVLVIGCPCALSIATPLAVLGGVRRLNDFGILLRKHEAFERAATIDTLIVDKTGTMTLGQLAVKAAIFHPDYPDALLYSLSTEFSSDHPMSKAIVRYASDRGLTPLPVREFRPIPGFGVYANVCDHDVTIGSTVGDAIASPEFEQTVTEWKQAGYSVSYVVIDDMVSGAYAFADTVRPEAYRVVAQLQQSNIRVIMASGDHQRAVQTIADEIGIHEYYAHLSPTDKAALVLDMQKQGHQVAFLGDGINDAAALVQSTIGLAMGSGADLAIQSGHFILAKQDLRGIPNLLDLGKKVTGTIRFNLGWAIIYNFIALCVAVAGFASPAMAALAMLISSAFVLGNSLRIFGWSPLRYARGGLIIASTLVALGALSWFTF